MDKKSDRSPGPASAPARVSTKLAQRAFKPVTSGTPVPVPVLLVAKPKLLHARPPRSRPVVAPLHSVEAQSLEIARSAVLKFAGSELKPMSKAAMVKFLKSV